MRTDPHRALEAIRETPPASADHLWHWIRAYTGIRVARAKVCRDHSPPLEWLARQWLERPPEILILGPRGGGKSFLQGLLTHLESRHRPGLGTRILAGSEDQGRQVYEAIDRAVYRGRGPGGSDAGAIRELLRTECRYRNGSAVSILAASETSVRGPHVASLRLDEVELIDPGLRDSAIGACMALRGVSAAISYTSTRHRVGGPMAELVEQAQAGRMPAYTTCTLDVLERCPESRSGPHVGGSDLYERCPQCPIVRWCHSERDRNGDRALAKLADGHYAIDSLAQKARTVHARTFEAEYLCREPRAQGVWFEGFDEALHRTTRAEYDPARGDVHQAIDTGVYTGGVWFQVSGSGAAQEVTVFADYLAEGLGAEANARAILEVGRTRCTGRRERAHTDPAGNARTALGTTVLAEYERAGLKLAPWPARSVRDGLELIDSFLTPADGVPRLLIHPRCVHLIAAFRGYARARRQGQWMDYPEDPQHPHEDLIDPLRGGLVAAFPQGRRPEKDLPRAPARSVFP